MHFITKTSNVMMLMDLFHILILLLVSHVLVGEADCSLKRSLSSPGSIRNFLAHFSENVNDSTKTFLSLMVSGW